MQIAELVLAHVRRRQSGRLCKDKGEPFAAVSVPEPPDACDGSRSSAAQLWIVADNLRKGAALNAMQIAELVLAHVRRRRSGRLCKTKARRLRLYPFRSRSMLATDPEASAPNPCSAFCIQSASSEAGNRSGRPKNARAGNRNFVQFLVNSCKETFLMQTCASGRSIDEFLNRILE